MAKTGNNVFRDQIPSSGPITITAMSNRTPNVSFNSDLIISKNPPKDTLANNRLDVCQQSKHDSQDP